MEEELEVQKLNIIDRIRKRLLIRNMQRKDSIDAYKKLSNTKLKNDSEIVTIALDVAGLEELSQFPENVQLRVGQENPSMLLRYCDPSVQRKVTDDLIMYCSDEVQISKVKENPELLKSCAYPIQENIIKENNNLLSKASPQVKRNLVERNPELIKYAPDDLKQDFFAKKYLQNDVAWWNPITAQCKNLEDIQSLIQEVQSIAENMTEQQKKDMINEIALSGNTHGRSEIDFSRKNINNNLFTKWVNGCTEEQIDNIIEEISRNATMYDSIRDNMKNIRDDYQKKFWDNDIIKDEITKSDGINFTRGKESYYGQDFINKQFREVYGREKYLEYQDLINSLYNKDGFDSKNINVRISNMLFREETLINDTNAKDIERYLHYDGKVKQKKLEQIIENAYGEKAGQILHERNGLLLEDIDNTEIFSPEIMDNFRDGFVQDLLSYKFDGIDSFIKIAKSPEDLQAFKFYYGRTTNILGENALTMQCCMERYSEFSDILKQSSQSELTEEQLNNLDALCMWRKNIAGIAEIEELTELEEKLQTTYKNMSNEEKTSMKDEDILYSWRGDEAYLLDIVNKTDDIEMAIQGGRPISDIYLKNTKLIYDEKKRQMELFGSELTDASKIDEAIAKGKDNVKKLVIDGVEVIDLGDMKCNFARHQILGGGKTTYKDGRVDESSILKPKDYVSYDRNDGISTISARPVTELDQGGSAMYNGLYNYVYWNFKDIDIAHLGSGDGGVSHVPKLIKTHAGINSPLKNYSKMKAADGGEIAFYRRYRNHERIEQEGHGGKIMPDAIIGNPRDPIVVKIAQERFTHPVPILCDERKLLQKEENIEMVKTSIKQALGKEEVYEDKRKKAEESYDLEGVRFGELQEAKSLIEEGMKMPVETELSQEHDNNISLDDD